MPDFDHVLSTTRAVRKRLDLERPVEPVVITDCLRLAAQAPTGGNIQTWRFVVVTDPELAGRRSRSATGRAPPTIWRRAWPGPAPTRSAGWRSPRST